MIKYYCNGVVRGVTLRKWYSLARQGYVIEGMLHTRIETVSQGMYLYLYMDYKGFIVYNKWISKIHIFIPIKKRALRYYVVMVDIYKKMNWDIGSLLKRGNRKNDYSWNKCNGKFNGKFVW